MPPDGKMRVGTARAVHRQLQDLRLTWRQYGTTPCLKRSRYVEDFVSQAMSESSYSKNDKNRSRKQLASKEESPSWKAALRLNYFQVWWTIRNETKDEMRATDIAVHATSESKLRKRSVSKN